MRELSGASTFADRVIIVLGAPRSGTSWLSSLIEQHPEVAGAGPDAETTVFNGLWALWENMHRVDGEGISGAVSPEAFAAAARQFTDAVFSAGRERHKPDAGWFIEKTPGHTLRIPLMAMTHPDAWYVHVIRDGRDVARSHARAPFGPTTVAETARLWRLRVQTVREQCWRLHNFRELRYEELVQDPIGHMADLFGWLGLPVDDDLRGRLVEAAGREVSMDHINEAVGAGKWRTLSPDELADIYDEAGDLLAELGYLSDGAR